MKILIKQILWLVFITGISFTQSIESIYYSYSWANESMDKVDPFIVIGPDNQIGLCYTRFNNEAVFWSTIEYVYEDQQSMTGWGYEFIEYYVPL